MTAEPLPPGATLGILGGGQLGRMLALAAARLGIRVHVYDPVAGGPAAQVAAVETVAGWDDTEALSHFAGSVDAVTYEFENIPTASLDAIEALADSDRAAALSPSPRTTVGKTGSCATSGPSPRPLAPVGFRAGIERRWRTGNACDPEDPPFGYDGKGQGSSPRPADAAAAWAAMADAPSVLEGLVPFSVELSVIGARTVDGAVACFDPGENVHEDGILRRTSVPARVAAAVATDAVLIAGRILNALDYVGVLGVELFVTEGELVVNEIAPRVHNSGHWTQTGCTICQFEQHVRAVCGWPLGDGSRHSDVVMENLIGDDIARIPALAAEGAALHLYGKTEARPGRKMGHVNRIVARAG